MTITEIAIRRPVFLLMIISVFIIFGLISLSRIGVSFIPSVGFPMIAVTAVYPGAGPEEIETSITKPVEEGVRFHAVGRHAHVLGGDQRRARPCERVENACIPIGLGVPNDLLRPDPRKARTEPHPPVNWQAQVV